MTLEDEYLDKGFDWPTAFLAPTNLLLLGEDR